MLILGRKTGERIHIGDDIEVVVLEARRGHVRLGFVAPSDVKIYREEVVRKMNPEEARRRSQQRLAAALNSKSQSNGSAAKARRDAATA